MDAQGNSLLEMPIEASGILDGVELTKAHIDAPVSQCHETVEILMGDPNSQHRNISCIEASGMDFEFTNSDLVPGGDFSIDNATMFGIPESEIEEERNDCDDLFRESNCFNANVNKTSDHLIPNSLASLPGSDVPGSYKDVGLRLQIIPLNNLQYVSTIQTNKGLHILAVPVDSTVNQVHHQPYLPSITDSIKPLSPCPSSANTTYITTVNNESVLAPSDCSAVRTVKEMCNSLIAVNNPQSKNNFRDGFTRENSDDMLKGGKMTKVSSHRKQMISILNHPKYSKFSGRKHERKKRLGSVKLTIPLKRKTNDVLKTLGKVRLVEKDGKNLSKVDKIMKLDFTIQNKPTVSNNIKEDGSRTGLENNIKKDGSRTGLENNIKKDGSRTGLENNIKEDGSRTGLENNIKEDGSRTGLENNSKKDGSRTGLENNTKEDGSRTGLENNIKEDGSRTGLENNIKEDGSRIGLENNIKEDGSRTGLENNIKQDGSRTGLENNIKYTKDKSKFVNCTIKMVPNNNVDETNVISKAVSTTKQTPDELNETGLTTVNSCAMTNQVYKRTSQAFCCKKCPAKFSKEGNLQNHLAVHREMSKLNRQTNRKGHKNSPKKSNTNLNSTNGETNSTYTATRISNVGNETLTKKVTGADRESNEHVTKIGTETILKCDVCGITFKTQGNLTRHLLIHSKQTGTPARYSCEECGKKFLQKCDLKRHEHTHSGMFPFQCDTCNKGFVRKSDLTVHSRFHLGHKTHACKICSKAYFQQGDLSRHVRQSHGDTCDYSCEHCHLKYTTLKALTQHLKIKH